MVGTGGTTSKTETINVLRDIAANGKCSVYQSLTERD